MHVKTLVVGLAAALFATGTAYAADCTLTADAQAGKTVSNMCKSCHVFEADKPSRPTAPNLHDVYGSKPGSRKDFPYSDGITTAAAKGITWTDDTLNAYISDPKGFLSKTAGGDVKFKMVFSLKDDTKRKNVIAFLKEIKGNPACN